MRSGGARVALLSPRPAPERPDVFGGRHHLHFTLSRNNMGFRGKVARSTLADANEAHDWRIYADFAQVLIHVY